MFRTSDPKTWCVSQPFAARACAHAMSSLDMDDCAQIRCRIRGFWFDLRSSSGGGMEEGHSVGLTNYY
eukprot:267389-Rhodomonas_salina.1